MLATQISVLSALGAFLLDIRKAISYCHRLLPKILGAPNSRTCKSGLARALCRIFYRLWSYINKIAKAARPPPRYYHNEKHDRHSGSWTFRCQLEDACNHSALNVSDGSSESKRVQS